MFNIFAPFVVTLAFFNSGARLIGQAFLPQYFYHTERIFIPPHKSSVSFNRVWPLAQTVTRPEYNLDQELIFTALQFAHSVPDFKTCFPQIWDDIKVVCSRESSFVSEYKYTVMALRILNCLHHRSLGIEEINFESIDQNYMKYSAMIMTGEESSLYQTMYNVARGLCLNEKRDRAIRDVYRMAKNIENSVVNYLKHTQGMKTHLTRSLKMFMIVRNKKQRIHDKFVNETGRFLQQIEQKSTERFKKHMEYMKIIVKQSISHSESVETSLNNVEKDFRKIDDILRGKKNPKEFWSRFQNEYSERAAQMKRKLTSIELKLDAIYQYHLKRGNPAKNIQLN